MQSKASNTNQLIHFLNIATKTDTEYKASKNQRLLVEVMLMQLCSLDSQMAEKKKPIIKIPFNLEGNLTSPKIEQSRVKRFVGRFWSIVDGQKIEKS